MKFKDLLMRTEWSNVLISLQKYYPDSDKDFYQGVYNKLLTYESIDNKEVISIFIEEDKGYVEVFATENGKGRFSIDFTPWNEWLGFETNVKNMSYEDFIAHCLWEMTFYGDEQDINDKTSELEGIIEKIENNEYEIVEEKCSLCDGTNKVFGQPCFCNNGMISIMRAKKGI